MIKRIFAFLALASCLITACARQETTATQEYFYKFTDSLGTEITLEQQPQRVAVLFSSYAEIWDNAGGIVSITVGDSVTRGFADEERVLVNDGAGLKIDMEALVAAQPDFVIATRDLSRQKERSEKMRELGVPSALFREENFDDYLSILKIFTDICGSQDLYDTLGTQVGAEIEKVKEDNFDTSFTYLFIRCGSAFSSTKAKTAEDHFACVALDELGGHNIADVRGDLASELSLESVLLDQPEYIFIVPQGNEERAREYMDSVLEQDGWKDLQRVKNGRVEFLEKELFNYKPNQKWAESYRVLADIVNNE